MKITMNTSDRDAHCGPSALNRCQRAQYRMLRVVPLLMALTLAVAMLFVVSGEASAQNDVNDVLDYVESKFGGYGLRQAVDVVISPDDKHVYALSEQDDAVVLFERDTPTGSLTYVGTYVNGENNVSGMRLPLAMAMSADGLNLYVVASELDLLTGQVHGTVVVFHRSLTDGSLTYVETQINNQGDVVELSGPDAVGVSPDGLNVYVAGDIGITVFKRDAAADGELVFVESETGDNTTNQLRDIIIPENNTVYVSNSASNGIAVLERDTADQGKLRVIQTVVDGEGGVVGLAGAEKLSASPDGQNLYVTGSTEGTLAIFNRVADGKLDFVSALADGEEGVEGIGGARSVVTSPDGNHVYVAGTFDDSIAIFDRDGSGKLAFVGCLTANGVPASCQTDVAGLNSPTAIAISDDNLNLYVTARESDALSVYDRTPGSGELALQNVLFDLDGGVPGIGGAFDVAVSDDGKHVYVAAYNEDSLSVFERAANGGAANGDGGLTFVEEQVEGVAGVTGMSNPTSVAVSPDGKQVFVTAYDPFDTTRGYLIIFNRDAATGKLTWVETKANAEDGVYGLAGASNVVVSPDNTNVYVTGITEGSIAVFGRNPATGVLTEMQLQIDGVGGFTGLAGAVGIDVSDDGQHVYVTGSNADSVVAFRRADSDGWLTWIETKTAGEGGVYGLNGAYSVDVSPDGRNVYVASQIDGAVTVFMRDEADGTLRYIEALSTSAAAAAADSAAEASSVSAAALLNPQSIALTLPKLYWSVVVSPDNNAVYATAWTFCDGTLSFCGVVEVFGRHGETGILSRAQLLRNDEGGIRGLRTPTSLAVSEDGQNVYATSLVDSAVLTFEVVGVPSYTSSGYLPHMSVAQP